MNERALSEVARAIERYESGEMDRVEAARFYQLLVETGARLADANPGSALVRQTVYRPDAAETQQNEVEDDLPDPESISLAMLEAHPAAINNPASHALQDRLDKVYREHVRRIQQRHQEALAQQNATLSQTVEHYEQRLQEAAGTVVDKTRALDAEQARNREEIAQLRRQYATLLEGKNRQLSDVEAHYRRQVEDLQQSLTAHDARLTEMEALHRETLAERDSRLAAQQTQHREEMDRLKQQHDRLLQAREAHLVEVESRYQRQIAAKDEQLAQRDRLYQEQESGVAARLAEMEERCREKCEASDRTIADLEQRVKKAEDWTRVLEHDRRHQAAKQQRDAPRTWWRRNR